MKKRRGISLCVPDAPCLSGGAAAAASSAAATTTEVTAEARQACVDGREQQQQQQGRWAVGRWVCGTVSGRVGGKGEQVRVPAVAILVLGYSFSPLCWSPSNFVSLFPYSSFRFPRISRLPSSLITF